MLPGRRTRFCQDQAMLMIPADEVARRLPFERLIPALHRLHAEGACVPTRQVHSWPDGAGGEVTTLIMPAWQEGRWFAVKVINIAPGNAARGLPGLHASVLLHDARTGVPVALIDGNELTARRTAATSALGAALVLGAWGETPEQRAQRRPLSLLVVGAGRIAGLLPQAYQAVMPLGQVQVWARRAQEAQALAERWCAEGLPARACHDLGVAAAQADIVSCATLATQPVVQGAWLKDGSLLNLIGSFTPQMREADDACFCGADLYLDTEEALAKSGDLLGSMANGVFQAADVRATLSQLCRGERQGSPLRGARRAVFKSVGHGLQDLCAASVVMAEPCP